MLQKMWPTHRQPHGWKTYGKSILFYLFPYTYKLYCKVKCCIITKWISHSSSVQSLRCISINSCIQIFNRKNISPTARAAELTPPERAVRERAYTSCQEWVEKSTNRYKILAHLDTIGCRLDKNWFLIIDTTVQTNRLMAWVPLPDDCIALQELSPSNSPNGVLMELLGSLQHPYIYPVLDLGIFYSSQTNCACLVMPINERGSLKDYIHKVSSYTPIAISHSQNPFSTSNFYDTAFGHVSTVDTVEWAM